MRNPCDECIVKACCIQYCDDKLSYNKEIVRLYKKGKNIYLFEKAIDDVMKLVTRIHGRKLNLTKEKVRNIILQIDKRAK